jgi:hypothetical protein
MTANPFTISDMRTYAETPAQYLAQREENLHHVLQEAQNRQLREYIEQLRESIEQLNVALVVLKKDNRNLHKQLKSEQRNLEEYIVHFRETHEEAKKLSRENAVLHLKLAEWLELINEQQQKIDAQKQVIESLRAIRFTSH